MDDQQTLRQAKENEMAAPKKYLLVAEDDRFYANVYTNKLAREGYEVKVVGDGQQILDAVGQRKPDLILLDLVMPVLDGFETLKELKANPDTRDIPVIVLSSLGQEEDATKIHELGAVDYFVKTNITIHDMVAKIKEHLGQLPTV